MVGIFPIILWASIGVIALILDIITSSFIFVWFTIGAIAAIVTFILGYGMIAQIGVFMVISIILIAIGYPLAKKVIKDSVKEVPIREESYLGRQFILNKEFEKNSMIKLDGIYWTAESEEKLKSGDKVKIINIKGNKIILEKINI